MIFTPTAEQRLLERLFWGGVMIGRVERLDESGRVVVPMVYARLSMVAEVAYMTEAVSGLYPEVMGMGEVLRGGSLAPRLVKQLPGQLVEQVAMGSRQAATSMQLRTTDEGAYMVVLKADVYRGAQYVRFEVHGAKAERLYAFVAAAARGCWVQAAFR